MNQPQPPARNVVIASLREGLGVEDIAVICECRADQVRAIAAELRSAGIMRTIRFDQPRRVA